MNILLITQLYPHYPGQPRTEKTYALHDFARCWVRSPQVAVLVVDPSARVLSIRLLKFDTRPVREADIDGIKIVDIPLWNLPLWNLPGTACASVRPIVRYLRENGFSPDIVLAHHCARADVAISLSKKLHKPAVLGVHQSDLLALENLARLLPSFRALAFRSKPIAEQFLARFPRPATSFVASSGIEESLIINEGEFLAKRFHHPLRITSVGSLIPLKNIDTVLRALARLPPTVTWAYTIAGDGPEREGLEALAGELGLRDRVTFLGARPRTECMSLLRRSDVFVLVSSPESFGLVYLEALANGTMVIGCKGTGIDGIIKHAENGFLCTARAHDELAELLRGLALDGEPAGMRARAYATIRDYTLEKRASDYLRFLRGVAETTQAR